MKNIILLSISLVLLNTGYAQIKYFPPTDPLVVQNLEKWQDLKFGFMMHWGTYSQWGIVESWALCSEPWCTGARKGKPYTDFKSDYEKLSTTFNPTQFDPSKWADAAADAGMKYVVFTTKHHDGFSMFDTKQTDYKITGPESPFAEHPKANVTKEIFEAFREKGFMTGAYFSKPDWHHPDYWASEWATPNRCNNYDIRNYPERWQRFRDFTYNQIGELMTDYGKVDILWLDGGWVRPDSTINEEVIAWGYDIPEWEQDIDMPRIVKMAREKQPGLIVVDRTVHGPYENYLTPEQKVPDQVINEPWETCMTMADGWSYSFNPNYKSTRRLIHTLVDVVVKGGNFLLNIGPSPDGTIDATAYDRLKEIGDWMEINGEAIYSSRPIAPHKEGKIGFTQNRHTESVYATYLADEGEVLPPTKILLQKIQPKAGTEIILLGHDKPLKWEKVGTGCLIHLPTPNEVKKLKGQPAWTVKIRSIVSWSSNYEKVDPFIGTGGKGKTYPGATTPFGMVQLSPDNGRGGWDWISGYFYPDSTIAGFSHTHLSGTGIGELYDISFMPFTKPGYLQELGGDAQIPEICSRFSHQEESAQPGYYAVHLSDYDIQVELTASTRCGFQRYRFPKGKTPFVKLDLGYSRNWDGTTNAMLKVLNDSTLVGYRYSTGWAKDQRVYFASRLSQPIKAYQLANHGQNQLSGKEIRDKHAKIEMQFSHPDLLIKTGISSVSYENALENLENEIPHWQFKQTRQAAKKQWEQQLAKIDFQSEIPGAETIFYTALYQSMVAPTIFQDLNGEYKGADSLGTTQQTNRNRYTTFSLWDTFRAAHPLFTLLHPDRVDDMVNSMLAHDREYGLLPVWDLLANETNMMIGYHAIPVIADAYLKGFKGFDAEKALEAMVKTANQQHFGLEHYKKHDYIPADLHKESVSLTLEYAFDDWCIASMAKAMGKKDIAETFFKRATNWQHLFDQGTGFMRGKNRDGSWEKPFDPFAYGGSFIEANAWQYTWFVPHDVPKLIELFGNKKAFVDKLDLLYTTNPGNPEDYPEWISGTIGQYVHGNEPSHHFTYLYNFAGQPHKAQKRIREICTTLHLVTPEGICGNEDCGQMSAWYIFSSLGFYPVNPADGKYFIGSPIASQATLFFENGKQFKIIAENNTIENPYIQSIRLNGKPLDRWYLEHQEILKGGEIHFVMGPKAKF